MRRYFTILFLFPCIVVSAQHEASPASRKTNLTISQPGHSRVVYKIIECENHTYGYDIISDDRLLIHQCTVPGVPGKNGFRQKADAEKVAQLVTAKIKQGEFPPTITQAELQNLDIKIDLH